MSDIEYSDRYGGVYPDIDTCCNGLCEGMGVIPVHKNDSDEAFRKLWKEAEAENPSDDGVHFISCPKCRGTGNV